MPKALRKKLPKIVWAPKAIKVTAGITRLRLATGSKAPNATLAQAQIARLKKALVP